MYNNLTLTHDDQIKDVTMSGLADDSIKEQQTSAVNNNLSGDFPQVFYHLFKGRTDTIGLAGTMSTKIKSEEEILQYVKNHLDGTERLGFYNLLPDLRSPWAMVEFEDHGKPGDLQNAPELSLQLVNHLKSKNIHAYRELSKNANGKCYHVWIFFEHPISAEKLNLGLNAFVRNVMNIKTEVFPKGYDAGSFGNFVWLPLFGGKDSWGLGIHEGRTVFIDEDGNPYPDQYEFVRNIQKVREEDFDRFIKERVGDVKKEKGNSKEKSTSGELVDGLDKVRQCSFMKHCEAEAANLPEPQWYAWITNAVRCKGGQEYIHEYSSKYPGYSKEETDEKILHALEDTGPMTHEQIEELGFECDCPKKFKSPISRAWHKDIAEEIKRIKVIQNIEEKLSELQILLKYWSKLESLDKSFYKGMIKKAFNLDDSAFTDYKFKQAIDLAKDLKVILGEHARDPYEKQGELVYSWMKDRDIKFFLDRQHTPYLFAQKKLMTISKLDKEFESYFYDITGKTTATKDGEVCLKVLQAVTERDGKRIDSDSWIHTDREQCIVYFNLNNDQRELVKILPNKVSVIENGSNDEQILLQTSAKILPIEYNALDPQQYKTALENLRTLVIDNLACKESDRIFSYAWKIAGMFFDFTRTTPHLRFEGDSSSGKSTAMELISYPLYGDDQKKIGTIASNYSDGAMNPLVLLDNIEVHNMTQALQDFIITSVTGMTKEKRKQGTDREVVQERTKCLICSTGIENLSLSEMINRTYLIEFDRSKYGTEFTDSVFIDIVKHRNDIMSAEFQLASRVLKKIESGVWSEYTNRINKDYPGHAKDRANSFLALMILIAEELLSAWDSTEQIWRLASEWIKTQNEQAGSTTNDSNPILQYLSMLKKEALKWDKRNATLLNASHTKEAFNFDVDPKIVEQDGTVQFTGFAKEFHSTFSKLCQSRGMTYAYKSAMQLAKRIQESKKFLESAGWKIVADGARQSEGIHYTATYSVSQTTNT